MIKNLRFFWGWLLVEPVVASTLPIVSNAMYSGHANSKICTYTVNTKDSNWPQTEPRMNIPPAKNSPVP